MKIGHLDEVVSLRDELDCLIALRTAAMKGVLTLTANYDGSHFDFGQVLTSDETRNTLGNLIMNKMEIVRGKLRGFGVNCDE